MNKQLGSLNFLVMGALALLTFACAGTQTTGHATTAAPVTSEPTPTAAESTARAFAHCGRGQCDFDMTLAFATGDDGVIRFERCRPPRPACGENVGRLTHAGLSRARATRDTLAAASLQARYGCPGCADGPRYQFKVSHANAAPSEHLYDPTRPDELPKALADAHTFFDATVDAVMHCKASPEVELVGECQ